MFQLGQFKNDNEKNYGLIDKLKCEIESLNRRKVEDDRRIEDLNEILGRKDKELDGSNVQIVGDRSRCIPIYQFFLFVVGRIEERYTGG